MKKTLFLLAAFLAACASAAGAQPASLKITVTSFPIYDWVREVAGTEDIVLLQQSGADLHSYIPGAADLRKIAASDLFVYVGGESDDWVERALAQGGKPGRRALSLVKALGDAAKEEEAVEGMEHGHEHEEHDHGHDHEEEHEIDEHVWLSLRNAAKLVDAIASELAALDPANAAKYRANAKSYAAKLAALDGEYSAAVAAAKRKTILVADRFPFRYLADDYGLKYYAAFAGCSAESEASFKTIMFLAKKTDELAMPAILTMEGDRHKIAETVRRSTKSRNQQILVLDSMQSVTGAAAAKTSYLETMRRNLETLKKAIQ